MNIGAALRLLAVMVLWASCFPLITIGLDLAPHLAFAALRAALAVVCLERVELNQANAFTFLVPIFGLIIGAAFFSERLEAVQIAGVVLVLAGVFLVQRDAGSTLLSQIRRHRSSARS